MYVAQERNDRSSRQAYVIKYQPKPSSRLSPGAFISTLNSPILERQLLRIGCLVMWRTLPNDQGQPQPHTLSLQDSKQNTISDHRMIIKAEIQVAGRLILNFLLSGESDKSVGLVSRNPLISKRLATSAQFLKSLINRQAPLRYHLATYLFPSPPSTRYMNPVAKL